MNFDIVGKYKLWFLISGIFIVLGIFGLFYNYLARGKFLNFGIDFTGGTVLTVRFDQQANIGNNIGKVRSIVKKYGIEDSVIQLVGDRDISIRTEPLDNEIRAKIIEDLSKDFGQVELLEADTIGPSIGRELRSQAFWALVLATSLILIYISFRFEFKYAVAAVIALWHDAVITIGLIALLWKNVDTAFVAAILTILGYSINDTIVIFDRIRENLQRHAKDKMDFISIVNESILQTMARSINTVLTVLFVVVSILLFGGATLKDFSLVLFIGFTSGMYSSIFIASPILVLMEKKVDTTKIRK